MRSLKHTLILWVVAAVVVLTAASGVSFYLVARAYLIERFDDDLEARFEMFASSIEIEHGRVDTGFDELEMDDFGEAEDDDDDEDDELEALSYLSLTGAQGPVYRSPSLGAEGALPTQPTEDPVWVDLPGGRRGRVYSQTFLPPPDLGDGLFEWAEDAMALGDYGEGHTVAMSLALDSSEIDRALSALALGLIAVGAVLAILMSIAVGYGVRRGLRPVDELTARLAAIDPSALAKPIEPGPLPAELRPIVTQYNALLTRVAQAYQRERGFSADAAHELRTPLAGLRTTLEVALAQPRTPAHSAEVFGELAEVTEHMRTIVEALLKLAAIDAGTADAQTGSVQLDEEIERVWRLVMNNGVSHRVFETTRDLNADAPIATRPGLLELVLRNILHNAAAYVDNRGIVSLASEMDEATARITVTNSGSQVTSADVGKVFDRFWRADNARAGTGKHCGLGLALTKSAVHALGGTIHATSEKGGTFAVTIELPRR